MCVSKMVSMHALSRQAASLLGPSAVTTVASNRSEYAAHMAQDTSTPIMCLNQCCKSGCLHSSCCPVPPAAGGPLRLLWRLPLLPSAPSAAGCGVLTGPWPLGPPAAVPHAESAPAMGRFNLPAGHVGGFFGKSGGYTCIVPNLLSQAATLQLVAVLQTSRSTQPSHAVTAGARMQSSMPVQHQLLRLKLS